MSWFARTLEALGLRGDTRERAAPGQGTGVIPALSIWQQFHRIGGGLTPGDVSNIIREADTGRMYRLMDLANDARQKDCHLQAVLAQSEEAISGLQWELVLPENALAREKKAAEWVDATLRDNASFHRLIAHLSGAVFYGYAVSEILWTKDEGRLVPYCFENIDARRFAFRQEDGAFVWWDEGEKQIDFLGDYENKFVTSRPRVTGDVPCREGLVRVLMWAALFRNWTLTDWLRLGEIAWKPWRIGKYRKDAAKEDIAGLLNVLEGMSTNGVAKIPETIDVDVKWAPHGTNKPLHEVLFECIAREMSKAALGQTETTQASTSSGYAQAKVHNEVRKDLREARARQIGHDLTRDVVRAMIHQNFGVMTRVPRLQFVTQDPVDLGQFSKGVLDLKTAGTKIPQSWVREQAGIPEPKNDEELLGDGVDIPIDPATGLPQVPQGPNDQKNQGSDGAAKE